MADFFDIWIDFKKDPTRLEDPSLMSQEPEKPEVELTWGFSQATETQIEDIKAWQWVTWTEQVIQNLVQQNWQPEDTIISQENFFEIIDNAKASWEYEWISDEELLNWFWEQITKDWVTIVGLEDFQSQFIDDKVSEDREWLWSKLLERWEKIKEAFTTERTAAEVLIPWYWTELEVAWQVAWGLWDIIWEWVVQWFNLLGKWLSAITPDFIEEPIKEAVWTAWTKLLQSDIWQQWLQALQTSVEAYQDFAKENPKEARKLESIWNILSFAPIWAIWWLGTKTVGKWIGWVGEVLEESAKKSVKKKTDDFVNELIQPIANKKQAVSDISKWKVTEWWIFSGRQVWLTKQELDIVKDIKAVPWIWSNKTILENNNSILAEIWKLSDDLTEQLSASPILIPKKETRSTIIKNVKKELADNPLLVWDAEKTATKILNKFNQLVDEQPWTALWLLNAKKALDNWIKWQKPNAFTGDKENALTIALKSIRTNTNDLIDTKAIDIPVKETLKKQSNLYRAIDNIAPKARLEASSGLWRLMQKIKKYTWIKWELVTWAWLLWWATLTTLAPAIAGIWVAWLTGIWLIKWMIHPTTRKFLGKSLININKVLEKTPNPDLQAIKVEIEELLSDNNELWLE